MPNENLTWLPPDILGDVTDYGLEASYNICYRAAKEMMYANQHEAAGSYFEVAKFLERIRDHMIDNGTD